MLEHTANMQQETGKNNIKRRTTKVILVEEIETNNEQVCNINTPDVENQLATLDDDEANTTVTMPTMTPAHPDSKPNLDDDINDLIEDIDAATKADWTNKGVTKLTGMTSHLEGNQSKPKAEAGGSRSNTRAKQNFRRLIGKMKIALMSTNVFVQSIDSKRPRHMQDDDEPRSIQENLLYNRLKPVILSMRLCGIFFIPSPQYPRLGLRAVTGAQLYTLCLTLLLSLNALRTFTGFNTADGLGTALFFKYLTTIFTYEAASRAALAYQNLFLRLERVCYPDRLIPYERHMLNYMYIFLGVTLATSICNAATTAYGLYGPPEIQRLYDYYLVPVPPDLEYIWVFKAVLLLLTFVNGQVAILSLSFYAIVCYILYKEFEYLNRTFALKIKENGEFSDDLVKVRVQHQKRCCLVEETDMIFKYYIANTYFTNVPLLCLLLYSIVYTDDSSYRFISAFRLGYVLFQMIVLSVAATLINSQAHAPLNYIYNIKPQVTSAEKHLEISMFLNKLTGTSIGLTAWDVLVINKQMLLTVAGLILTYFFLLVQFKSSLSVSPTCHCVFAPVINSTAAPQ